jgi:uncharacterized protein (DUF362 family)
VHAIDSYVQELRTLAHPEGGWGYAENQKPHLEPTCLALLALANRGDSLQTEIERSLSLLHRSRNADGACRLAGDREETTWMTALVLFVENIQGAADADVQCMVQRLLTWQSRKPDGVEANEVHDIDVTLAGWPWAENNFAWVEPTAWACMALRRAGHGDHLRVQEGLRLLLDRAFEDGGINYGNRFVLGKRTEPIPGPTALMLLALQGRGDEPRVAVAVKYLLAEAFRSEDTEHLCWAKLALDCYRDNEEVEKGLAGLDDRILAAYQTRGQTPWLKPATVRTALTILALQTEKGNPFRIPESVSHGGGQVSKQNAIRSTPHSKPRRRWGDLLASKFRGLAIEAVGRLRQLPPQSTVHIARAEDYNRNLADALKRQYAAYRERLPLAGKRVVLKPNLVEYHRNKVINTHPNVVAAVIELCRQEGAAEIIVAEGPGHWRNVEYLVEASGLGDVLRHYRVSFVDINHDETVKTPNLGRLTGLEYLYLSKTIATAEVLISLPKLKTHHWAGATLSLKNLFGTLPGICYGWPKNELHWRGIDNSIVDIALTRTPDLAIVDGIIGMEGDGPLNGTAKPFGALVMGNDLVAVDATCCRLMGLDPEKIRYLGLGYQKRLGLLGEQEIVQIGESLDDLAQPFATVEHFNELRLTRGGCEPLSAAIASK